MIDFVAPLGLKTDEKKEFVMSKQLLNSHQLTVNSQQLKTSLMTAYCLLLTENKDIDEVGGMLFS